jgi:hypothetical protein
MGTRHSLKLVVPNRNVGESPQGQRCEGIDSGTPRLKRKTATPKGGRITVHCSLKTDHCRVSGDTPATSPIESPSASVSDEATWYEWKIKLGGPN